MRANTAEMLERAKRAKSLGMRLEWVPYFRLLIPNPDAECGSCRSTSITSSCSCGWEPVRLGDVEGLTDSEKLALIDRVLDQAETPGGFWA